MKLRMVKPLSFDIFWNTQEPRDVISPPGNLLEIQFRTQILI